MRTAARFSILALSLATLIAHANTTISTLGQQTTTVQSWGTPDSGSTPTYGESFVAPADPFLQSITFVVRNPNSAPIPFIAYVYQWDGTKIFGPALFTSSAQAVPPSGANFVNVTVATTDTQLQPGQTYVALFSTIGFSGHLGGSIYGGAPISAYPSGKFEYNNSLTLAGLFTPSPPWNQNGDFGNLVFELQFTSSSKSLLRLSSWWYWYPPY
jgi:hypothetical protein